jgi:ABC-type nitrate/sulfonate/bicarbonate transport system substrate-binding protein
MWRNLHMILDLCWFLPLPAAVIAKVRGFYEPQNLRVQATSVRSSDEQFDLLASGAVQAAVTAMDNVFGWNRRGGIDDLRVVAQMERSTHSVLMGAPGIRTIDHLRGGVLLVDSAENGFVVVTKAMLQDLGLEPGDYRLSVVGGVMARVDSLCNGEGDAALLVPLFEKRVFDAGGHVLMRVDELYPDFPGQGLVTRASQLSQTRAALATWLDALSEASAWARSNRAESLAMIVGETGLPHDTADQLLDAMPQSFLPRSAGLNRLVAQRTQLGLLGAENGRSALFDPSVIR